MEIRVQKHCQPNVKHSMKWYLRHCEILYHIIRIFNTDTQFSYLQPKFGLHPKGQKWVIRSFMGFFMMWWIIQSFQDQLFNMMQPYLTYREMFLLLKLIQLTHILNVTTLSKQIILYFGEKYKARKVRNYCSFFLSAFHLRLLLHISMAK